MSDAAFREALDAYISLVQWLRAWALNRDNTRPSEEEINAARARVLALNAERQGEVIAEFVAPVPPPDCPNVVSILLGPTVKPGDKVRVTKVEEGK